MSLTKWISGAQYDIGIVGSIGISVIPARARNNRWIMDKKQSECNITKDWGGGNTTCAKAQDWVMISCMLQEQGVRVGAWGVERDQVAALGTELSNYACIKACVTGHRVAVIVVCISLYVCMYVRICLLEPPLGFSLFPTQQPRRLWLMGILCSKLTLESNNMRV